MERLDNSRENIRKALCELVGRKDAAVFQSADTFEKMLLKIGNWTATPETTALKAGLQDRIPWELQKGSSGPVSRAIINSLAANIARKHQISQDLAVWAIESWSFSLGLKFEAETVKTAAPASAPTTAAAVSGTGKASATSAADQDWSVAERSRAGIIFGTDASGLIRVFKSWWRPAPEAECAGLTAVAVKAEAPLGNTLFVAAAPRKKTAAAVKTPVAAKAVETRASAAVAPKPVVPAPAAPGRPVAKPAPAAPAAPDAPVVYNGTADQLCDQARALMPGFGTRVNMAEALQILQQAVKLGSFRARRMIGEIYHKGLGVKQDFRIAADWFRLAAENGDAQSQFYLGTLYQCGMGVEFNLAVAQGWLQKAAQQGHQEAKALLIEMLQA